MVGTPGFFEADPAPGRSRARAGGDAASAETAPAVLAAITGCQTGRPKSSGSTTSRSRPRRAASRSSSRATSSTSPSARGSSGSAPVPEGRGARPLAAGIAHDFNNLLTAICGYADARRQRSARATRPPAVPPRDRRARSSAPSKLTRQLLAFSRRDELEPQPVVPRRARPRHGVDAAARRRRRRPDRPRARRDAASYADPGQLEQVLMNLVVNARDAGAARRPIRTTTATVARGVEGERLGIAPASTSISSCPTPAAAWTTRRRRASSTRSSRPSTARAGTGLGLSLAHSVIRQSGGAIEVSSAPGTGRPSASCCPLPSRLDWRPLMAVPKRKTSKARRDKRRATHKLEAPRVNTCPQCGSPKRAHRVCPTCGTYRGREVEPLRLDAP